LSLSPLVVVDDRVVGVVGGNCCEAQPEVVEEEAVLLALRTLKLAIMLRLLEREMLLSLEHLWCVVA
jgi:hypothetical protein